MPKVMDGSLTELLAAQKRFCVNLTRNSLRDPNTKELTRPGARCGAVMASLRVSLCRYRH